MTDSQLCVILQKAAITAQVPCCPHLLACHGRSSGTAAPTGQVCCPKLAGIAAEAGLAAVEAGPQASTGSSPAAVQQNGV